MFSISSKQGLLPTLAMGYHTPTGLQEKLKCSNPRGVQLLNVPTARTGIFSRPEVHGSGSDVRC